jgi:hypothetical protein
MMIRLAIQQLLGPSVVFINLGITLAIDWWEFKNSQKQHVYVSAREAAVFLPSAAYLCLRAIAYCVAECCYFPLTQRIVPKKVSELYISKLLKENHIIQRTRKSKMRN